MIRKLDYYYLSKPELVRRIALKMPDVTIQEIKDSVDVIIETLMDGLAEEHNEIHIRNFGKFTFRVKKPRKIHHPGLRTFIQVPRRYKIMFEPCQRFFYKIKYSYKNPPLRLQERKKK